MYPAPLRCEIDDERNAAARPREELQTEVRKHVEILVERLTDEHSESLTKRSHGAAPNVPVACL